MSKKNKKIYPVVDKNFIDLQNKFNDVRAELEEHGAENRHSYPLLNELTTDAVQTFYDTFVTNKQSVGNQDPSVFMPNEEFLKSKYGISNIDNKTTDPAKKQEYVNKMSRFIQTVTKFATIYNKVVYAIGTLSTEAVSNINGALESIKNDENKAKVESLLTELNNKPEFQNSDLEKLSGKVPEITADDINNIVNKYLSEDKLNMSLDELERFDVEAHVDELDLPIDLNSDTNLESLKKVRLNDGVSTIETELDKLNKTIKRDLKAVVEALKAGITLSKEKAAAEADAEKINEILGVLDGYLTELNNEDTGIPSNTEVSEANLVKFNDLKANKAAKLEEIKNKLDEIDEDSKAKADINVSNKLKTLKDKLGLFDTFANNIKALVERFHPKKPDSEDIKTIYDEVSEKGLLTKSTVTEDDIDFNEVTGISNTAKNGTPYNVAELEELLDDFNNIEKDKYVDAVKVKYNFGKLLNEEGMAIDDTSDLSDIKGIIGELESRLENANDILAKYTSKDPKLEYYKDEINDVISKLNEKLEAARQAETNKKDESTEPGNGDTTGGDGTEGGSGDNGNGTSDGNTSTDTTEGEDSNTGESGDGDTSGTGTEPNTGNGDTDTEETPEADPEYDDMVNAYNNILTTNGGDSLESEITESVSTETLEEYLEKVKRISSHVNGVIDHYPSEDVLNGYKPERKDKWTNYKTNTLEAMKNQAEERISVLTAAIKARKQGDGLQPETDAEYDAMVEKFTEEYGKLNVLVNNALLYDINSADASPSDYLPLVEAFKTYLEETIKNYPDTDISSAFSPERKSKWDTYKTDTLDHNLTIAIARIKELKDHLGITDENESSTEETDDIEPGRWLHNWREEYIKDKLPSNLSPDSDENIPENLDIIKGYLNILETALAKLNERIDKVSKAGKVSSEYNNEKDRYEDIKARLEAKKNQLENPTEEPAPTEEPDVEKLKEISIEIENFKNTINTDEHDMYAGLTDDNQFNPSPYVDAVSPISRAEHVENILSLINELTEVDKKETVATKEYLDNINEFIGKKIEKHISEDYLRKIGKSPTGKSGLWSIYEKLYKDSIDLESEEIDYILEDSRGELVELDKLYNILNDEVNNSFDPSDESIKMTDKIDSIINKIRDKASTINYFIKMDEYKYTSETDPEKYNIIKVIKPLEAIKAKLLEKEAAESEKEKEAKKEEARNKLEAFKAELEKITTSYTAVDGTGLSKTEDGAVNFITTLINDVNNIVEKVNEAREHHPDFKNEEDNTFKTEYPEIFRAGETLASKKLMDYLAAASDRKNGFGKTIADWIDSLNRLWNRKSTEEFSTDSEVYKSILYTLDKKEKIRGMLNGEAETAFQLNRSLMGSNGIFSILESLKEYYDSTIEAKGHKASLDGVDIPELVINDYLEKYNAFKAGTITSTQALNDLKVNDDSELVTETLAKYETNKANDITYYDSLNNEKAGLLEKERIFEENKNDEDALDGEYRYRIPNKLDRIKLDVIHRHETILDIKAKINEMIEDKNKVVETISTTIEMPMSIISSERDVNNE